MCLIYVLWKAYLYKKKSRCLLLDQCLDIAIAAASSSSIGSYRWSQPIKPFIRQFAVTSNFTVGESPEDIQVSGAAYSVVMNDCL